MKKILIVASLLVLGACSSLKKEPKTITNEEIKNWDKTIAKIVVDSAYIPDEYGNEDPIYYLRKTGKMSEKDFQFLSTLNTKNEFNEEEIEKFTKLLDKYPSKIDRKFFLEDTNIKNPKALVDKMVNESRLRMANPSNHISSRVATEEEWEQIVAFSKKDDLNEKDVKKLRKLLNNFIKRKEFFDERSWYGAEISSRLEYIVEKSKSDVLSKKELNNINAKALYIAYPDYLSPLDRWKD
ncbi:MULTISPECIES: hypothetical protein [Fusobacterium]|uniref:hypothetical protein n=1 Tax=Fusobacterium TaxID=848 RepID=UPI001476EDB2|nr:MULTISPECIES: hypothetical protein [Fusobacterium]NME35275.1 hypothetical protein [Fusobacterium sp. FSA-380-WT-3A]